MKAIETFAFGIAFGLIVGMSYGMQHPITPMPTAAPVIPAAVEPEKKAECEPKAVFTVPKFLGPYKRGSTGVMHALLSFYDHGPGSINDDQFWLTAKQRPVESRWLGVRLPWTRK